MQYELLHTELSGPVYAMSHRIPFWENRNSVLRNTEELHAEGQNSAFKNENSVLRKCKILYPKAQEMEILCSTMES